MTTGAHGEDVQAQLARDKEVSAAFSPAAPVNRRDLFAGRIAQLAQLVEVLNGRGEHGVIYGERGVGKTSLVAVAAAVSPEGSVPLAVRVNCAADDDFGSIWKKALSRIKLTETTPGVGFSAEDQTRISSAAESLPEEPAPYDVEGALGLVTRTVPVALFFDEYDRLSDPSVSRLMADTIKTLSDQGVDATIVLVGVADDVSELIAEHESIERGLSQIAMPRMSTEELESIVNQGLATVGMGIEQSALDRITMLSQGLPHYTHLLAQEAARAAVWASRDPISLPEVISAMQKAIERSPQTLAVKYHAATTTPRRERTLWPDVLLAAALTRGDELGYFSAADVREPLRAITREAYEIPRFSQHLHALCEDTRGSVLQKAGASHRWRFRFRNPALQPYVILKALTGDGLQEEVLNQFLS